MTREERKLEKERLKAEANLKKNGPAGFAKNFMGTQLLIMYLVIVFSNVFNTTESGVAIPRYIGVLIFGFISAFFAIKKCLKLCTKDEYTNIKKLSHVYIGVVAVGILCYGLYSVSTNIKGLESKFDFLKEIQEQTKEEVAALEKKGVSLDDMYSEEDVAKIEEIINMDIDQKVQEANTHWFVVALVYAVAAEIALFLAGKNVSIDSLPDSREDATLEKVLDNSNIDNTFAQTGINPTIENNIPQEEPIIQANTQDIKFDL